MSAVANSACRSAAEALSALTNKMVTTMGIESVVVPQDKAFYLPSRGLSSIQALISANQLLNVPASSKVQLEWHKCHAPLVL